MQAITYELQTLKLVEEMLESDIRTIRDEMTQHSKDYDEVKKIIKVIDDKYKKREKDIIKALIRKITQLVMQQVKQLYQPPMLHGPQKNLLKELFDKQNKEQIKQEILAEFQKLMPSQVTGAIVMTDLNDVIENELASELKKQVTATGPIHSVEVPITIQERKQPQETNEIEKLFQLWKRKPKDQRLQYYLDKQIQNSRQYLQICSLYENAVKFQTEAHQLCQQPDLTAYINQHQRVSVIKKEAVSVKKLAQKPKRDRYYLKIACYIAMLSKDTAKLVSDFMYHACRNYV